MNLYIFVYNVVAIKAHLENLTFTQGSKKVLIASDYAIQRLSDENRILFDDIYSVSRHFHQVVYDEVECILKKYLNEFDAKNIHLLSNEDSTQLVCGRLREKYGLKGFTSSQLLPYVNKEASKIKLSGCVRMPRFMLFDKSKYLTDPKQYIKHVVETIGLPIFIKPVDLVSSMGTHYVNDIPHLEKVMDNISLQPWQFEIDEYIDGELYHCDFIMHDNRIEFFSVGFYANPLAQFSKGRPMGSIPVVDQSLKNRFFEFCEKVINRLGMMNSAFHVEIFMDKISGELIFLEAAARTPGALVPEMYEIIYGTHLELMHYQTQLDNHFKYKTIKDNVFAGWITYPKIEGVVKDIVMPKIDVDHQFSAFVHVGEHLNQAETLLDAACSIVFWCNDYKELRCVFEELKKITPLILNQC